MDITSLELLLDIASTGNLSVTARNFGYTQSAVSHTIKKLESEMGFSLLKRTNRGVELSNDLKTIMPSIRSVVNASRHLDEEIQAVQGIHRGALSIGSYSSTAINWLPMIIRRFQHQYPDISIRIREGGLEEIEEWMQDGSVDFGIMSNVDGRNYTFLPLTEEPLYAVFPTEFDLPEEYNEAFPVTAFTDYPFITSETGMDYDVAAALQNAGVVPNVAFRCKDDHSIIAMVEKGLGVTLLPALIIRGHEDTLKKITLDPPVTRMLGIGIMSEGTLSLSARAFIEMIREFTEENDDRDSENL